MIDTEFVLKARETKKQVLKELEDAHNEILSRNTDAIRKRHNETREKVIALQERKSDLLSGEITNKELIENAKEELKRKKTDFIIEILMGHLSECKERNARPFDGKIIRDSDIWKILFLGLSDEDIEWVVGQLPNTGMSVKVRMEKIRDIDNDIESLRKTINDEVQALGV